jgi:hypothetical protein
LADNNVSRIIPGPVCLPGPAAGFGRYSQLLPLSEPVSCSSLQEHLKDTLCSLTTEEAIQVAMGLRYPLMSASYTSTFPLSFTLSLSLTMYTDVDMQEVSPGDGSAYKSGQTQRHMKLI